MSNRMADPSVAATRSQRPALTAGAFLRSIDASRGTLQKPPMRLLDLIARIRELTNGAPYAVLGGLAQILWARKTHTDDLDVVLASERVAAALEVVRSGHGDGAWALPVPPDVEYEADEVFEVAHVLHDGAVVDLLSFRNAAFNQEILSSAQVVAELGGVRFIAPELLLVTHLLRPGPSAAIAAVELVVARRAFGGLDVARSRTWADAVGRGERLERVLAQAAAFDLV